MVVVIASFEDRAVITSDLACGIVFGTLLMLSTTSLPCLHR